MPDIDFMAKPGRAGLDLSLPGGETRAAINAGFSLLIRVRSSKRLGDGSPNGCSLRTRGQGGQGRGTVCFLIPDDGRSTTR